VSAVLDHLRRGTLAAGVPQADLASVTGVGQSLGVQVLVATQARHRTFDGVAMLGSSMAGTALPVRPGVAEAAAPEGATPEQTHRLPMAGIDWNWAFHWEDTVVPGTPPAPRDGASLVAADIASGLPARHTAVEWGQPHPPPALPSRR
jgi:hypothetical protein